MAGEVEAFQVVDLGVGERLVSAGDAFSGEQVEYGGFGDAVSLGECECGGAVAVVLDECVDGVAGQAVLDVPARCGLWRCGGFPLVWTCLGSAGFDFRGEVFEFPQVVPFRVTPSQVHNSYNPWSGHFVGSDHSLSASWLRFL